MHPPLKTSDKKLEEEYEVIHRIFAAVQTTFELLCNRLLNLTADGEIRCQESTLVSGEKYSNFQKRNSSNLALSALLAPLESSLATLSQSTTSSGISITDRKIKSN